MKHLCNRHVWEKLQSWACGLHLYLHWDFLQIPVYAMQLSAVTLLPPEDVGQWVQQISTAFSTCSPFFGFVIKLLWVEFGPIAERHVPPTVNDPGQTDLNRRWRAVKTVLLQPSVTRDCLHTVCFGVSMQSKSLYSLSKYLEIAP